VTASFGYAIYNPVEDENLEDTRKRADELMYKDKQEYKKNR
jgi:GGDEF domain-containing protein